ncbi:hypothetical protein TYM08_P1755 [Marinicellulosiphila megalodicopiae]
MVRNIRAQVFNLGSDPKLDSEISDLDPTPLYTPLIQFLPLYKHSIDYGSDPWLFR